ncbi:MAG: right-handed parallel beta-helix repeat-containing protein, partial [Myxococcota bacterium]|nr:right-handed parallel beta-helix repeat-containing protein [Myxococcota bacterium]
PDEDADGANVCEDCDDNDKNNFPGNDELCDDQDNDCDDKTDEGFILGVACDSGEGDCIVGGLTVCAENGLRVTCDAEPNLDNISDELCDSKDNDCDGAIDEEFDVGELCVVGEGACRNPQGTKQCAENATETECVGEPLEMITPESCNGLDDDCDGKVDEEQLYNNEFLDVGQPCDTALGACRQDGMIACSPDGEVICAGPRGTPLDAEICNGIDDDCDGRTDETFDLGVPCNSGRGECVNNGVTVCAENGLQVTCNVEPNDQNRTDELCDDKDNDCDGQIDEDFDVGDLCVVGVGVCENPEGVKQCAEDAMSTRCVGDPLGAAPREVCNGLDDDCDGKTDEKQLYNGQFLDVGSACDTALGICRRDGTLTCDPDGGDGVVCNGPRGTPLDAETCNGDDDDCDGAVDEGNPGGGAACVDESKVGRCTAGVERCVDGAVVCRSNVDPIVERCNREDDDCDGLMDEVARLNEPCRSNGTGQCQRNGRYVCAFPSDEDNNGQLICNAENGDPIDELCNGLDDDCDGIQDEGNPEGGAACDDERQMGRCRAGIETCTEGNVVCRSNTEAIAEACNRVDDDCDGRLDEVATVGDQCTNGLGECRRNGLIACVFPCDDDQNDLCNAGDLGCNATPGQPGVEICDGLDNNCNGIYDEGFNIGQMCTVGTGECSRPGLVVCTMDGTDTVCEGNLGNQEVEQCNGRDDDCDGQIDERGVDGNLPESGGACQTGRPGRCGPGVLQCETVAGQAQLTCVQTNQAIPEICNGLDDDCQNGPDNGFTLGEPCTVGFGQCQRNGVTVCGTDDPDDGDGLTCSAQPAPAQDERCNNLDDDCDNQFDEGIGKGDPCVVGEGICQRNGVNICAVDGSVVCSAQPGPPRDPDGDGVANEICTRLDDDCDGKIDEGNPEGGADCPMGNPGICSIGVRTCQEDGVLRCVAEFEPGDLDELCNGDDDDCDGFTDEARDGEDNDPEAGQPCQTGKIGECADGTTQCVAGVVTCLQNTDARPELCDGLNNDCDRDEDCVEACADGDHDCIAACSEAIDEDFPGVGLPCDSPDDDDLCARGILQCDLQSQSGTVCVGDVPVVEVCNNQDDDCDGVVDNGIDLLNDPLNCGACDNVCPGPNPECVEGACFRTFWVSESEGSNATGDGSRDYPWRTIRHALSDDRVPPEDLNRSIPPARVYVLPGRYAADQWDNVPQCDADGDDILDAGCAVHAYPCEDDNNPTTDDVCTRCVCLPDLVCANELCRLPVAEHEVFPVTMLDTVQVVGFGDPKLIVLDGGTRPCFVDESTAGVNCDRTRSGPANRRGQLLQSSDNMDERARRDPDFHVGQPRWFGIGSRNLFANFTLLRGGFQENPAMRIDSSQPFKNAGRRTTLQLLNVRIRKFLASQAYSFLLSIDADVLLNRVDVRESNSTGSRYLILANRANITMESSHFQSNNVTDTGTIIKVSDAWLDVRNSTFTNNIGGGIWFHDQGRGMVVYSSFGGNSYINVTAAVGSSDPIIVANNVFVETDEGGGATAAASTYVHSSVANNVYLYNNLFNEPSGPILDVSNVRTTTALGMNNRSFADRNRTGQTGVNVEANNMRITATSKAIDRGTMAPLPQPKTNVNCQNDGQCLDASAQDPRWNLPAEICGDENVCVVDVTTDRDQDTYPDWMELILGSNPDVRSDLPPEYAPRFDFDGVPRPSGDAYDVGAFEFPQAD